MCSGANDESNEEENYKLAATLKAFYHRNSEPTTSDILKIQSYLNGSDAIKDISPQFATNVNIILEKYQNDIYVIPMLKSIVSEKWKRKHMSLSKTFRLMISKYLYFQTRLLAESLHGKNSKINVDAVKEIRRRQHLENGDQMDQAYLLKVMLSKQLPPERVNGIINLILMVRRNATDDEIENALVS